jgi:hypothetical protein
MRIFFKSLELDQSISVICPCCDKPIKIYCMQPVDRNQRDSCYWCGTMIGVKFNAEVWRQN